ncbi:MAG TPA: L,D-transpeptidase family protein [Kineosporiaceae bacterium]|nr:L,D-transpeptidase family protein [Kineosporiaceae bacterium]
MITTRRRVLAAISVPVAALAALAVGQTSVAVAASATSSASLSAAQAASASVAAASAATSSSPLLTRGSKGAAVLAAQKRLAALGYWLGTPDGVYGDKTVHAVIALQKVAGLARDGVIGPKTTRALAAGVRPKARTTRGDVIEVDLAHQVVLAVHSGRVNLVFDASTGSGAYYYSLGRLHHAVTPKGTYHVYRAVNGWDPGPLGKLYRPRYFNGGIAVHGYPSVPTYPASHGCVRVTIAAIDYVWARNLMPIGRAVVVR